MTKIQIIKYASLKTTPAGDVTVDGGKMIAKTQAQILNCLDAYAAMGEKISLTAE